jgi:hypothetical protein
MLSLLAAFLLTVVAPPALARPVKPSLVTASSSLGEDNGVNYDVENVADNKLSTVWVEGEQGSGLGSSVSVELGAPAAVRGFKIWNGNWYTPDFWQRHNRIKDVEVEFSDGTKQSFTLKDEMAAEEVVFAKPVTTSSLKLKVKSVYGGSTFPDTCISELQVLDGQPSDSVHVAAINASSVYPADSEGSYDTANLRDGMSDSMWCEGAKTGDGTGEWLEFDFGGATRVGKLRILNGNGYGLTEYLKGNRATTATLTFDNGATEQITLKKSPAPQTVTFTARTASRVKITFNAVELGTEFKEDLCVSEAAFLE